MSIHKELARIQKSLKAPKNQNNKFGGYQYRSCEDILEALKTTTDYAVKLTDSIEVVADRVYVKAIASLIDADGNSIESTGFAREPLVRKGMDESQITGATSSYARKYALNALFSIDDTRDADATNDHGNAPQAKTPQNNDPEKDWYNDFDNHKELMCKKISSGETADQIIANLRKNFKVSKQVAEKIKALGVK